MLGFCGDKRSFRVQSFHPIDGKAQQLGKLFSIEKAFHPRCPVGGEIGNLVVYLNVHTATTLQL